jgi:hypothetical protein
MPPRVYLVPVILALLLPGTARAWIYPEHRDVARAAYQRLSPEDRESLDRLWAEARPAFAGPICDGPDAGEQGLLPACIDFAAFAAIAGDHSCSPKEVVEKVLPGTWILRVAHVAAETKLALATAPTREEKLNRLATSNLALQSVDPEYATRAGANNAHFLLPREPVGKKETIDDYLERVLSPKADINATGLYAEYHMLALRLAALYHEAPASDRADLARRALRSTRSGSTPSTTSPPWRRRNASPRPPPPIRRGPRWRGTLSPWRATRSTGSRTSTPPGTSSAPGEATPGARERTTTTTSSASTPATGRVRPSSPSATPT